MTSEIDKWSPSRIKDDCDRSLENIRMLIDSNDKMYEQRYQADQQALRDAFAANDKRLNIMNQFCEAMVDQASKMMTRAEFDTAHRAITEKMEIGFSTITEKLTDSIAMLDSKTDATIAPLHNKVEQFGKLNWTIITSFLSIAGISIAGLWLVLGLKIDNSSQPLSLQIEQLKATVEASSRQLTDQRSNRDKQLEDLRALISHSAQESEANAQKIGNLGAIQTAHISTVDRLASDMATLQALTKESSASNSEKLIQIETQLHAVNNVINMNREDIDQQVSMMWKKVFHEILPPKAFRPDLYEK
jgi:uncharacterized coiled-coil DUF342 family protein